MATSSASPQLIGKKGTKSRIWKYFAFEADDHGVIVALKPVCKRCHCAFQTEAGNTTNLVKHLKDRHPDLFKEFNIKYDKNSNKARKLDGAVAEFMYMDQVPVYIVEKHGFQQILQQFNPRYQLPSNDCLINRFSFKVGMSGVF